MTTTETSRKGRRDTRPCASRRPATAETLLRELRAVPLTATTFVAGLENRAATTIIGHTMPTVDYRRIAVGPLVDEHVILDIANGAGVRVVARWDWTAQCTLMEVAEVGGDSLWDTVRTLFARWENSGRPVEAPGTAGSAS